MPDSHTDSVEVADVEDVVNSTPCLRRSERSSASTVTVIAPSSGPKSSTHENAKISETESRASIDGILSVKSPLTQREQREPDPACRYRAPTAIDATEWVATTRAGETDRADERAAGRRASGGRLRRSVTARYLSCGIDVPQTTYSVP